MKERACLNCQNESMLAETRPIPRAARLPLLGNYLIEKYFPSIVLAYTTIPSTSASGAARSRYS